VASGSAAALPNNKPPSPRRTFKLYRWFMTSPSFYP
jgi:hypothetical protein